MTLLTDALRSGPGSPEWQQAVKVLRASNQNIDEFTMLYAARERLESGKDYRSVKAGPDFTRKVLSGIDEQGKNTGGVPTANLIGLIAAAVILAVVVIVAVVVLRSSNPQQQAIEDLTTKIFGNKFLTANFAGDAPVPAGWTKFGDVPLIARERELRPSTLPAGSVGTAYKAGGLVTTLPVPADNPLEVDVTARVGKSTDDAIAEVFVSDEPITDENAAGAHALVWQLKAGEARVFLADGNTAPKSEKFANVRELPIKMLLNRDTVIVETGGKRLYAGPHRLAADKPRYVGIRFRRRGVEGGDPLGILSVWLQKP